jgi:hypothetical protein
MDKEVHAILNLDKYAAYMRRKAALSYADNYSENLDEFISINQMCQMIKEFSLGKDEEGRYLIDEKSYFELFDAIKLRLYNVGLAKLAAKDLLECGWDNKKNEMIFWSKEIK